MNNSSMCSFMWLCPFDINYTSAVYIQITSHHSCIIGFQIIACFCINIPFVASICCTCWVCHINHLIVFHMKTYGYIKIKTFTVNIFLTNHIHKFATTLFTIKTIYTISRHLYAKLCRDDNLLHIHWLQLINLITIILITIITAVIIWYY